MWRRRRISNPWSPVSVLKAIVHGIAHLQPNHRDATSAATIFGKVVFLLQPIFTLMPLSTQPDHQSYIPGADHRWWNPHAHASPLSDPFASVCAINAPTWILKLLKAQRMREGKKDWGGLKVKIEGGEEKNW
ncbi:hypothetical protein U1Q18_022712 [Sarracenia purpurea var. burkii]